MLKRVLLRAAAVTAAVVLGAGSARADFVIDDFTTPPTVTSYSLAGGVGATYTSSGVLPSGVTRNILVTQTANGTGFAGQTFGFFGSGAANGPQFNLGTQPAATANVQLTYSYGSGQNLSAAGTSVQFSFLSSDLNVPFSVRITDTAGSTSTQSGIVTSGGAGVYSLSTGSFAGVNLTSVSNIILSLNRNLQTGGGDVSSADFALSDVRILTPPPVNPPVIPAPPAAVLALAALPLLGLSRVRRALTAG